MLAIRQMHFQMKRFSVLRYFQIQQDQPSTLVRVRSYCQAQTHQAEIRTKML